LLDGRGKLKARRQAAHLPKKCRAPRHVDIRSKSGAKQRHLPAFHLLPALLFDAPSGVQSDTIKAKTWTPDVFVPLIRRALEAGYGSALRDR